MSRSPSSHEHPIGGSWAFYGLMLILVLVPLPFGAVYQWTWAGLAVLVALLLLVSTPLYLIRLRHLPSHQARLWLPALLYSLVVAWSFLQGSDLTPNAWDHPVWQQSAEVLGETMTGTISLDPYKTRSESVKMLTYAAVFWLAVVYGRDRGRARVALWLLGVAGSLYAAYGLVAFLTDLGGTLFLHKMPVAYAGVSSTFVNRNMYVDYAGFGLLAVACLILVNWLAGRRSEGGGRGRWRRLVFGEESHILLLYTMGLVLLVAITMTGSRAGVLSVGFALVALIYLTAWRPGGGRVSRRQVLTVMLGLAAAVVLIYAIAGAFLGGRLATAGSDAEIGRIAGYRMILRAIAEAPFTGFGAGTSLDVFYLHNDGSQWKAFNYAHNIYLGAVVELGLPAAAALFAAVGLVALQCLQGIARRGRDQALAALGVGVTLLVAVHGLFDSPLYLAANAATFSFLLGLAYAQSWPTRFAESGAAQDRVSSRAGAPLGRNDRSPQAPVGGQSG